MCNICNQYNCCCNSVIEMNTTIVSDQAGRDDLSAKEASEFFDIKHSTLRSKLNGANKNNTTLIYL